MTAQAQGVDAAPIAPVAPDAPAAPDAVRELHIAGVLVQARAEAVPALCRRIPELPGATLTQHAEDGRMVVVVEGEGGEPVMQVLSALRDLPGVLNVALVYQHAEPWDVMQQEMP